MGVISIKRFTPFLTNFNLCKYDYSKVEYKGLKKSIIIVCPEHGEFNQIAGNHLRGHGCSECVGLKKGTTNNFIFKSREKHGNKYDYSKVNYINNNTKICIICPKHGEFWQTPDSHVNQKQGCPICSESKLERKIRLLLTENKIYFIQQYRSSWLKRQSLDFYLPEYKIAIECQGEQHFIPKKHFGGLKGFINTQERDKKKINSCFEKGIKIVFFTNVKSYLYEKCNIKMCKSESEVLNEINFTLINKK